jgi:hypothetical protein
MRRERITKAATWAGGDRHFLVPRDQKHDLRRRRLIDRRRRAGLAHPQPEIPWPGVDAYDRQTHGRAPQAEVISPGFKYNLADINAALALVQLENSPTPISAAPRLPNATCASWRIRRLAAGGAVMGAPARLAPVYYPR